MSRAEKIDKIFYFRDFFRREREKFSELVLFPIAVTAHGGTSETNDSIFQIRLCGQAADGRCTIASGTSCFTGLSGAGKTTIACRGGKALEQRLGRSIEKRSRNAVLRASKYRGSGVARGLSVGQAKGVGDA